MGKPVIKKRRKPGIKTRRCLIVLSILSFLILGVTIGLANSNSAISTTASNNNNSDINIDLSTQNNTVATRPVVPATVAPIPVAPVRVITKSSGS